VLTSSPKARDLMSLLRLYHVYHVEVDDESKWQAGGRVAENAGLGVTSALVDSQPSFSGGVNSLACSKCLR